MQLKKSGRALDDHTHKAISPRSIIPSGRAVIGGLLVTVAAIGTFAAYAGASTDTGRDFLVATTDLPVGHLIRPSDLRVEHGELSESLAEHSFNSVSELDSAVTLAPVTEGDLVQRSQVATRDGESSMPTHEFSFSIERERALNGTLRRGESVDVLATFGTGADSYTVVIARRARVIDSSEGGRATLGTGSRLVATLGLASGEEVMALAHASQVASVTIVRTTGVEADATAPTRYPAAPKSTTPIPDR